MRHADLHLLDPEERAAAEKKLHRRFLKKFKQMRTKQNPKEMAVLEIDDDGHTFVRMPDGALLSIKEYMYNYLPSVEEEEKSSSEESSGDSESSENDE